MSDFNGDEETNQEAEQLITVHLRIRNTGGKYEKATGNNCADKAESN